MSLTRNALLWAAQNEWLGEHLPRRRFVRAAIRRFMPGETLDAAIKAAQQFAQRKVGTTFTYLGEAVHDAAQADAATEHYLEVLDAIHASGLDTEISVKLTHLGYDVDQALATRNLERLAAKAEELGNFVWIDMESSAYVQGTVDAYREVLAKHPNTGICLQAYLKRTQKDVADLLQLGPAIRMVKGAYKESKDLVVGKKARVAESFFDLSMTILKSPGRKRLVLATHDVELIERIDKAANAAVIGRSAFEVAMLYGIRQADQFRLAQEGYKVRCLIAYGTAWYRWYVRRLAERPANVGFVIRNMFSRVPG
jgi:proline dehydrogenase